MTTHEQSLRKLYEQTEADHKYYTKKAADAFAAMQALDQAMFLLNETAITNTEPDTSKP